MMQTRWSLNPAISTLNMLNLESQICQGNNEKDDIVNHFLFIIIYKTKTTYQ